MESAPIASPESARTFWSISAVVAVCSCADSVDRRLSCEVLQALRSVSVSIWRERMNAIYVSYVPDTDVVRFALDILCFIFL